MGRSMQDAATTSLCRAHRKCCKVASIYVFACQGGHTACPEHCKTIGIMNMVERKLKGNLQRACLRHVPGVNYYSIRGYSLAHEPSHAGRCSKAQVRSSGAAKHSETPSATPSVWGFFHGGGCFRPTRSLGSANNCSSRVVIATSPKADARRGLAPLRPIYCFAIFSLCPRTQRANPDFSSATHLSV
jgi:hypothetical protein